MVTNASGNCCGTASAAVMIAALSGYPALCNPAAAYTDTTLYTFCSQTKCADGRQAYDIVMDQAGNLYGTTFGGGNGAGHRETGFGVIWELTPGTGQYQVIYKFCSLSGCGDGANPFHVKLVVDAAGSLYGTTSAGGVSNAGVVFELVRKGSAWKEKVLYDFCGSHNCRDGGFPLDGLTYAGASAGQPYDDSSPLYGTTQTGGANGVGTVFMLSQKSGTKKWTESVLHSFCSQGCADGENPDTPLYLDGAGNVYGTTEQGGQFGEGAVFEVSPNGSGYSESVLYSFCAEANCADGEQPEAGVIADDQGNLYGTTGAGGTAGDGVIFELSPDGGQWQYGVVGEFTGSNGIAPSSLMRDAGGDLFGTTYAGGKVNEGTVYKFNGSIDTLYSFCTHGCAGGKHPFSGVVEDAAGDLFGTTLASGANDSRGTVFELIP